MWYLVIVIWFVAPLVICIVCARQMKTSLPVAVLLGILFSPAAAIFYGYMTLSGDRAIWRIALIGSGLSVIFVAVLAGVLVGLSSASHSEREVACSGNQETVTNYFATHNSIGATKDDISTRSHYSQTQGQCYVDLVANIQTANGGYETETVIFNAAGNETIGYCDTAGNCYLGDNSGRRTTVSEETYQAQVEILMSN